MAHPQRVEVKPPRAITPAEEVEMYLIGRREAAAPEIKKEIDRWLQELRSR